MRQLLLAILLPFALTVAGQGFISPQAKIAKKQYEQKVKKARTRGEAVEENARMKLFVTCAKDADAREVANATKQVGAQVRMVKGNLIVLDIPYSKLEALAGVKGVRIVNMPPKMSKKSDVTRHVTQAEEVNDGSAPQLPQAYTGKDVIVGIIDTGFDLTHPMFKDKDGNLRIKGYYEPGSTTLGGDTVFISYNDGQKDTLSGSAYYKPEELLDTLKVKDVAGSHGSHCISIAAGSIFSDIKGTAEKPVGGVAPEADILICNNSKSENENTAWDFMESLYFLESEAMKAEKPLVVSVSQNSHWGWHDGKSDMARVIDHFCTMDSVAIMLCSSNEGASETYIHEKVKAKETLQLIPYTYYTDNYLWGGFKTEKNVKMKIGIANLSEDKEYYRIPVTFNSVKETKYGQGIYFDFDDGEQEFDTKEEAAAKKEFMKYMTGGQVMIFCYQNQALDQQDSLYTYTEVFVSMTGTEWIENIDPNNDAIFWGFNLYLEPEEDTELHAWADYGMYVHAVRADGKKVKGSGKVSVGDWNTSGKQVSVGAWCANDKIKYEGTEAQETGETLGSIAEFSSYGTDLAGHKHPDVCAPGTNVVAAINSFEPGVEDLPIYQRKAYDGQFTGQTKSRNYYWGTMSGTSMSTPAAAGVVALWMQAANDMGKRLTCEDIKDILAHSCDNDDFTKRAAAKFGYGKINAYKGLLYVLGIETSIPTLSKEQPRNVSFRVAGDMVYADGAEDGTSVAIYNLKGVLVRETAVEDGTISTAGLGKGVYAIQLGRLGSTLIRK